MANELMRQALAHDASHFAVVPDAVVRADNIEHVASLLKANPSRPVTFRGGGTSLSGQGQGAGLLVDVRTNFRGVEVRDDGGRVTCQPGTTLRYTNAVLSPYHRKLGPDPASEGAATIGGVVANNSSGMTCGTELNSYETIDSLTVVLPSGTMIETGAADADHHLHSRENAISTGLLDLRARIMSRPDLVGHIRRQFSLKNTMGYGLNSFLDHATPAKILEHLLIGSEGTLGFVGSATFRTVEKKTYASTALLVFSSVFDAMSSLEALKGTGASAIELMDAQSLTVGKVIPGVPGLVRDLDVFGQAALLVEHEGSTSDELAERVRDFQHVLRDLPIDSKIDSTTDSATRSALWSFRKGLYTSVAGARPSGSTALLEDVAVPMAKLADTCEELSVLFDQFGYENSVIFGHAKDGNIHFMLTDTFGNDRARDKYERFTEDMVDLILSREGTLKAEHGTGRVMAPFVERQYGPELYGIMRDIKKLIDPHGILNPDAILSDNDRIYLQNFKESTAVDPSFDRCTECGFCEPVCPSEDLTLTPRQRIATMRNVATGALHPSDAPAEYEYGMVDTCAADSMCAVACPLGIDTGELVKGQRAGTMSPIADRGWDVAARHWGAFTRVAATGLTVANVLPGPLKKATRSLNAAGRRILDPNVLPQWEPDLPAGGKSRRRREREAPSRFLYVPACVNSMFGPEGEPGVQDALLQLADAVGVLLSIPDNVDSLCCGTVWSSKGARRGKDTMKSIVEAAIATGNGNVTLVSDATSCTQGFARLVDDMEGIDIEVIDAITFARREILPLLEVGTRLSSITLHPTCSSTQLGLNEDLEAVARAVAETTVVPEAWKCCGFAGDRGMLHPELTASATAGQSQEVAELSSTAHASCNRTCEIGMTRATGAHYRHILQILRDCALD